MTGMRTPELDLRLIGGHPPPNSCPRPADIEPTQVAIFDLVAENNFNPVKPATGPFHLHLRRMPGG